MVMPRSRSRSILSRNCARDSRSVSAPVFSKMRSASVDFPWSMWAMMEKFRIRLVGCALSSGRLSPASWEEPIGRSLGLLGPRRLERHLARQHVLVMLEHHVDTLADVDGDRHLGSLVQKLQPIILLRRDVDGGRDLLSGHRRR